MLACPECRADLDSERLAESRASHCPFCGADVSQLLLNSRLADESEIFDGATPRAAAFRPVPDKPHFELVEDSADRLLFYIPGRPNKRARSLGIFALLWNGFIGTFIVLMTRAVLIGAGGKEKWAALPVLSIFGPVAVDGLEVNARVGKDGRMAQYWSAAGIRDGAPGQQGRPKPGEHKQGEGQG